MVSVRALTTEVLQVRASGATGARAAEVANAVAEEYVTYLNGTSNERTRVLLDGLTAQIADLEATIGRLGSEINQGLGLLAGVDRRSAEAVRQVALIDTLRAEQVEAARQLSIAKSRMADARLTEDLERRGTRVLEVAVAPSVPIAPQPSRNAVVGMLVGGLLGVGAVLLRTSGDGRLRRRDDIADASGAPVVASLQTPHRYGVPALRAVLGDEEPGARERVAGRRILASLGADADHPLDLVIVCLPGDRAGPFLAAKLAGIVAGMHWQTSLDVEGDHPTLAPLRSALAVRRPGAACLTAGHRDRSRLVPRLTITAGVAEGRSAPAGHEGARFLLAVSAGFATADEVAAAALACADAGERLSGVLVANPDPDDPTTGASLVVAEPTRSPSRRRRAAPIEHHSGG